MSAHPVASTLRGFSQALSRTLVSEDAAHAGGVADHRAVSENGPADHDRPLVMRPGPDLDRIAAQGRDPAEHTQRLFPGQRRGRSKGNGVSVHRSFSRGIR